VPLHYPRARLAMSLVLDGAGAIPEAAQRSISIDVEPLSSTWTTTGGEQADSASISLPVRALPLPPLAVKSAQIALYAADIGEAGEELAISDLGSARFIGNVDQIQTEYAGGQQTILITARDRTGLLLDTPWPGPTVRVDRGIEAVVRDIVSEIPTYADLPIVVSGTSGTVSSRIGRTSWRPAKSASLWSAVQELATELGLVARMDLDTLRLEPPQAATGRDRAILVYGQHIRRLDFARALNPTSRRPVRVVNYDDTTRTTRTAQFPARAGDDGVFAVPVTGQRTTTELQALAEAFYRHSQRGETRGKLETCAMRDLDDYSLLNLRGGDSVAIPMRQADTTLVHGLPEADIVRYLSARGMAEANASAIARQWASAPQYVDVYFARQVRHTLDQSGYRLSLDFQSYLAGDV